MPSGANPFYQDPYVAKTAQNLGEIIFGKPFDPVADAKASAAKVSAEEARKRSELARSAAATFNAMMNERTGMQAYRPNDGVPLNISPGAPPQSIQTTPIAELMYGAEGNPSQIAEGTGTLARVFGTLYGNPEMSQRSALASGMAEAGKPTFSATPDEGNRIAGRDSEARMAEEYAKQRAQQMFPSPSDASPFDKKFAENSADELAKRVNIYQQDGVRAEGTLRTVQALEGMLTTFEPGALAPLEKSVLGWAEAFGVPVNRERLAGQQGFDAAAGEAILSLASSMKGNLSDKDIQFLRDAAANPRLLREANQEIIARLRRGAETAMNRSRYIAQFGGQPPADIERRLMEQGLLFDNRGLMESASPPAGGAVERWERGPDGKLRRAQ